MDAGIVHGSSWFEQRGEKKPDGVGWHHWRVVDWDESKYTEVGPHNTAFIQSDEVGQPSQYHCTTYEAFRKTNVERFISTNGHFISFSAVTGA
jgi:hypothetical protein